ncbi:tRNA (adenosine(37)-N6)-threonylcarbamoyltransferase complex dimerization subunit type 1 TsaB [Candidatus Saccharibacteria bacterium]|nr:tRNA (adenosine(37)-N6)-threonylcarbamoyltransferase complex dimerization subunit type 1 TsaB [Candidatus Saccharibacteria bacterium]
MIILTLRTDKPIAELGLFDGDKRIDHLEWEAHRQLAETLHSQIAKLLEVSSLTSDHINGLVVYKGPGSFTGLRIGISVINALAYANGLSVVGESGDDWIAKGISRLLADENDRIVTPEYGAAPNITRQKK